MLHKIEDESAALKRLRIALTDAAYAVLRHNCERFARFITFGVWESKQLRGAFGLAGLAVVAIATFHDEHPRSRSLEFGKCIADIVYEMSYGVARAMVARRRDNVWQMFQGRSLR